VSLLWVTYAGLGALCDGPAFFALGDFVSGGTWAVFDTAGKPAS